MGFFDKLKKAWAQPGWDHIGDLYKQAGSAFVNSAKSYAGGVWNMIQGTVHLDGDQFKKGLAGWSMSNLKFLGGIGLGAEASFSVPGVKQVTGTADVIQSELARRPLAAALLQAGDAFQGQGDLFSSDAWRKAYNVSSYVTTGQAYSYYIASQQDLVLGGDYANSIDPRDREKRKQFYDNPGLKFVSGTADAYASVFADPTFILGKATKLAKLRFLSKPMTAAAVSRGSDLKFVLDSQRSNRLYDFARNAKGPDHLQQTVFANHQNGALASNLLYSAAKVPDAVFSRELFDNTLLAMYGNVDAWDYLTKNAPRIAQATGRIYANQTIADAAKKIGTGDAAAEQVVAGLRETEIGAFADAIANGRGAYGQLTPTRGGLLTGQFQPRVTLSSKWRYGVHQWFNGAPSQFFGKPISINQVLPPALAKRARYVLPSSRYTRFLDLNDINSATAFRSNLERSQLPADRVADFVAQYGRASSPESRFRIANDAENAAFTAAAARHGFTTGQAEALIPAINRFRQGARSAFATSRRFLSDDVRKVAERYRAVGREDEANNVDAVADDLGKAIERGEQPATVHVQLDEDGNTVIIPESFKDAGRPLLQSQHADVLPMMDWHMLDSALWWQRRGPLAQKGYVVLEGGKALLEAASNVWKVAALMRAGYVWRMLSDDVLRRTAVFGASNVTMGSVRGLVNSAANWSGRGRLLGEVVSGRRAARGLDPHDVIEGQVVEEGPSAGSDLVDDVPGVGKTYTSHERALADGAISFGDYLAEVDAGAQLGDLPGDLASIVQRHRDGLIDDVVYRKQVADYALNAVGRGVFAEPTWQTAFLDELAKRYKTKPQGQVGAPVTVDPFKGGNYVRGEKAFDVVPARLTPRVPGVPDTTSTVTFDKDPGWSTATRNAVDRSLRLYRASTFKRISAYIRGLSNETRLEIRESVGGPKKIEDIRDHIANMDKALAASPLKAPVELWRGLASGDEMFGSQWRPDGDMTGVEWDHPMFASTSVDRSVSEMFASDVLLRLHVPAGVGAVQLDGLRTAENSVAEAEVLLQRGLHMRVIRDNPGSGGYQLINGKWVDTGPEVRRTLDVVVTDPSKSAGLERDTTVMVDPLTGMSPSLKSLDGFTLSNTVPLTKRVPTSTVPDVEDSVTVTKAESSIVAPTPAEAGTLADSLYDYVHANLDDLLGPRSLLAAYVAPDGRYMLSVAKATDAVKVPVKMGSPRRITIPGSRLTGRPYRDAGTRGVTVRLGDESVRFDGAFEGAEGAQFRAQASSRGPTEAWADVVTQREHARLMQHAGAWADIAPSQVGYGTAWERAANAQLGNDPVARQFLAGKSADDVLAWLLNTSEGRAYHGRMGPWQGRYADQIKTVEAMVDTYVPDVGDLRKKVLAQRATFADFQKVVPDTMDMPNVHGASLDVSVGGPFTDRLRKWTDNAFKVISDLPADKASRFPFFAEAYQRHIAELASTVDVQFARAGKTVPVEAIEHIQTQARTRALADTKKYLYDTSSSLDLARASRLLVPFSGAAADSYTKWGVIFREKPWVPFQLWKVWTAPDKNGLVQDQDGNHKRYIDGRPRWVQINPMTGQETVLPDDYEPKTEYILFRLPFGLQPNMGSGAQSVTAVNKDTFNTFLGLPLAGPLVAVPANHFALTQPEFADNFFVRKFVLPYGPSTDIGKAVIPGTVRSLIDEFVDRDSDVMQGQALAIYQTEMIEFSQGRRAKPPTFAEARAKAADLRGIRFLYQFGGMTPSFKSPYQPYVDYYRQLRVSYDPTVDKETPDERFLREAGSEYFILTASVTRNVLGIPATIGAWNKYKKYQQLIEGNPDIAGLIIGSDGAGGFSSAVYQNQLATPLAAGSGKKQRERLSLEESVEDVAKRQTWAAYTRLMDAVDADLLSRGLTSLQQRGARDLKSARDKWIQDHMYWDQSPRGGRQVHPWFEDFMSSDGAKMTVRLNSMMNVVQDPRLQGRDDIRGLIDYLQARQEARAIMQAKGYKTLNSKQATGLRQSWNSYVMTLKDRNLSFAQLYNRWLVGDESLTASL